MRGRLGPGLRRIDGLASAGDHIVVDCVLAIGFGIGCAKDPLVIGLVLGKEKRRTGLAVEGVFAELIVNGGNSAEIVIAGHLLQYRFRLSRPPCPGVAKPQGRQQMHHSRIAPAIAHADLDQDVARFRLRILDKHVEVAVVFEHSGINQFIFRLAAATVPVGLDKVAVGILSLWVLIKILHVRVGRSYCRDRNSTP